MPQRITLADVRASRIPNVLGLPSTDTRVAAYVNDAQQRLLSKGSWVGTTARYNFCVDNGLIALPRNFEQVLAISVCKWPIKMRSQWHEFVDHHGFGLRNEDEGDVSQAFDRGTFPTQKDLSGTADKKVKVYCDVAEAATTRILIQGTNSDGNRVRTVESGVYIDGEYVAPAVAGTLTVNTFATIDGIQKPATRGYVRLYEYDTVALTQTWVADYEADETRPSFRRMLIAGLSNCTNGCGDDGDTCDNSTVTVIAKLSHVPVVNDTDWLIITSIPALKAMCQAIKKEDANLWDEAKRYEAQAVQILNDELNAYMGDSVVPAIRMPDTEVYGGGVTNVI